MQKAGNPKSITKYRIIWFIPFGVCLFWCFLPTIIQAQSQYNHPELIWRTIESEHAIVHFHNGAERTARIVAGIADIIYGPITGLYDYEPDAKVHWIVRDHDDYSNGASFYYDQKIEIWATALDFELRGTHNWLYNVVTHEFTHMIQLGASRKGPRWMPGIYFQYIDYEPEKRPDVLYGYPHRIMSWPLAGTSVPMWFAEGTAQFQVQGLDHDYWDSHRDMMMRTRSLAGELLSWNQMGVFGKNTYGSESVYNHGYALVRYIADIWGQEALADLSRQMSHPWSITFNGACRKVLGISGRELHDRWIRDITIGYQDRTADIRDNIRTGEIVCDDGFANLYPAFSPDGRMIAFMSNQGADYMSLSKMFLYDVADDSLIETECPARGAVSWLPSSQEDEDGGRYIAYARKKAPNRNGSHFNDIYLWDLEDEREIRLTRDARLVMPSFSPDGRHIVAVHNGDGNNNLVLMDLPDSIHTISADVDWSILTDFNDGRQIYHPIFSPDGRYIYCSTSKLGSRDIYRYDIENDVWEPFIATEFDERDITFSPDGVTVYWSDDRTGIFNIYSCILDTGEETIVTNVIGGAFMPTVNTDDMIAYAEFTVDGYGVRLLRDVDPDDPIDPQNTKYMPPDEREHFELSNPPNVETIATPYASPFGKLFVLPRIAWDYGRFKPGLYFYTSDLLERLNLFGAIAGNTVGDRDLYLSMEYRILKPTLFLEAFNITRFNQQWFDDPYVIIGEEMVDSVAVPIYDRYSVDYHFGLMEYNLGARLPLNDNITASVTYRKSNYKSSLKFDDGGSFDYVYFKGQSYLLRINSDQRAPSVGSDIHPQGGWRGWLEYSYQDNRFIEGFEIEAEKGTIQEVYSPYRYHRIETDIDYYQTLYKGLVVNPRLIGGWLSDDGVDPFFHQYAGGLIGLRGYSFYSLGGTKNAVVRLSLRFPITTNIDKRWGPFYLDRVYGSLFAEAGDAWTGDFNWNNIKRDVGAELRIKLFSWYGFPTDLQFTGAYGLDNFTVIDNFHNSHTYGKEWRWYVTLLFDFI